MRMRGRRVLCVCQKGNSRSVALAWYLKKHRKADALAIGIETAKPSTFAMMCLWADVIILTDKRLDREALDKFRDKLLICDVGTDIWFKGFDPGLIEKFKCFIEAQP